MKDLKVNTEMQVLNHFSQFLLLQLSLLTKLADLNVHKKKRTDVKNGRFYNLTNFFLILRRNEAERKHSAKNHLTTILFSPPIHSACTLPKGLPTSQSQKRTTTHLIPPYLKSKETTLFFFLSFCIFLLLFQRSRNRASTGLGLRANFCTLFLVRTCLKLPSPGHALRICLRHHFWTGLARLFRTIGI
jgi:hypothetical protein